MHCLLFLWKHVLLGFHFCVSVCSVHSDFVHHALVLIFISSVLAQESQGQRIFKSQQQSHSACHMDQTDTWEAQNAPPKQKSDCGAASPFCCSLGLFPGERDSSSTHSYSLCTAESHSYSQSTIKAKPWVPAQSRDPSRRQLGHPRAQEKLPGLQGCSPPAGPAQPSETLGDNSASVLWSPAKHHSLWGVTLH